MTERVLKILLLEDEDLWSTLIGQVVSELEWTMIRASSIDGALRNALKQRFDIVILDRVLSASEDGLALIDLLKKYEITPLILVISQLSSTGEVVRGLESGADGYLTKPFDSTELRARLVALARRVGRWRHYPTVELIGDLEVRKHAKTVSWKGKSGRLPDQIFDLLWVFVSNRGKVLSKDVIWNEVWPEFTQLGLQDNTLEVAIGRLRRLLKELTGQQPIKSLRGQGYRWEDF